MGLIFVRGVGKKFVLIGLLGDGFYFVVGWDFWGCLVVGDDEVVVVVVFQLLLFIDQWCFGDVFLCEWGKFFVVLGNWVDDCVEFCCCDNFGDFICICWIVCLFYYVGCQFEQGVDKVDWLCLWVVGCFGKVGGKCS